MKRTHTIFAILFAFSLGMTLVTACDDDNGSSASSDQNIAEITETNEDFSGFLSIVKQADITAYLEGDGPFTVFAPRNEAFKTPPIGIASAKPNFGNLNKEKLTEILKYHVLDAEVRSSDLKAEQTVEAAAGGKLFITKKEGEVRINDTATVTTADIGASNGVIHRIDQLLMPDKYQNVVGIIAKRYMLQTLENTISDADLTETLKESGGNGYTIFAPSDSAFEGEGLDLPGLSQEQLQAVLTYHVLPEKVLSSDLSASQTVETVNGESLDITVSGEGTVSITDEAGKTYKVTDADLKGTNGVVHIIDGVLMPE